MKSRLLNSTAVPPPPSLGGTVGAEDSFLPSSQVAARYHRTVRSIDRWVRRRGDRDSATCDSSNDERPDADDFPKPINWNGRNYWRLSERVAWERRCAAMSVGQQRRREPDAAAPRRDVVLTKG